MQAPTTFIERLANNKNMNYALISTAIGEGERGKLREGARLLAKIAHRHGIPVTWAITSDAARTLAKDITAWHTEFGDEPLLMVDIKPLWDANWDNVARDTSIAVETASRAEHLVSMREKLPKFITTEWGKLARAMPWAEPFAAGAVWKHHVLLHALEKAGFQCLWGYHHSDAETDSGAPFGCFYPSAEQHNFSATSAGEVVGVPYQSTPIENVRAALLNDTQLQNANVYLENRAWNRWLGYVEHIDALEVAALGQETLERLDAYFAHVAAHVADKAVPLSKMVRDYRENCPRTEPTALLFNVGRGPVPRHAHRNVENDNTDVSYPEHPGYPGYPAQKTLLYYDTECQFTFTEGTMEPVDMKNYVSPSAATSDGTESHLPKVTQLHPIRQRSELRLTWQLESTKAMPYGVTIWGDHGGLRLATSNAEAVTWIGEHLLFARLALQPGTNECEITLTI